VRSGSTFSVYGQGGRRASLFVCKFRPVLPESKRPFRVWLNLNTPKSAELAAVPAKVRIDTEWQGICLVRFRYIFLRKI